MTFVNKVDTDRPSVAVNSIVITYLPSRTVNSSEVIGQNLTDSPLAAFNLRIIAAIISFSVKSLKIRNYSHVRSENCISFCLPLANSKFNNENISISDEALIFFKKLNGNFFQKVSNITGTISSKCSDPLVIILEEHKIALKF